MMQEAIDLMILCFQAPRNIIEIFIIKKLKKKDKIISVVFQDLICYLFLNKFLVDL